MRWKCCRGVEKVLSVREDQNEGMLAVTNGVWMKVETSAVLRQLPIKKSFLASVQSWRETLGIVDIWANVLYLHLTLWIKGMCNMRRICRGRKKARLRKQLEVMQDVARSEGRSILYLT